MGQIISKNNKRKVGLQPGYTPKLLSQPTEEANIPMVQRDGSVRYVSQADFDWMARMGHIDKPKPQIES